MQNPFITNSPRDITRTFTAAEKEQIRHSHDYSLASSASPSRNWTWQLGSLLIRMGARLTKENSSMSSVHRNA